MTRTLIAALVLAWSPAFGQTPQWCQPHHDDPSYCERKEMQTELQAIQQRLDGRFVLIVGYQTSSGWYDVPPAASMARAEDRYLTAEQCEAAGEAKVASAIGNNSPTMDLLGPDGKMLTVPLAKYRCEVLR